MQRLVNQCSKFQCFILLQTEKQSDHGKVFPLEVKYCCTTVAAEKLITRDLHLLLMDGSLHWVLFFFVVKEGRRMRKNTKPSKVVVVSVLSEYSWSEVTVSQFTVALNQNIHPLFNY